MPAALLALTPLLVFAAPASAGHHRGSVGVWGAGNPAGTETFSFTVAKHGRQIRGFDGGLSPAARRACYGRLNFGDIPVSRRGRFTASFTTTDGTQQTGLITGQFTGRHRAVFYVRRIETPPGLPQCDSGPVRFVAEFII